LSISIWIDTMRHMARTKGAPLDPDVRLLAALADPTRLAIVRELAGSPEVCACDFTSCCDVRQPTVSHHLRVLREAGVIESERRGSWIWYRLVPAAAERLRSIAGALAGAGGLIPASALVAGRGRISPAPGQPAS
jgi:ArsR family transcriptional regulator